MEKQPLVSISCITYNHALYIRECLDGFLMQECDFDYEILIHDDASTDGTQDIIKEYVEKHPNIIKPIYQTENQYSKGVRGMMARFNFPRAKGKYIALCEGDDYWTDPLKLQKQVDFLERNQEFSLVSGGYVIKNDKKEFIDDIVEEKSYEITLESFFNKWHTKTLTVLFKKDLIDFNVLYKYKYARDYHLFFHLLDKKRGFYINEVFGVYNIHEGGIHSTLTFKERIKINYSVVKELHIENPKNELLKSKFLNLSKSVYYYNLFPDSKISIIKEMFRLSSTPIAFFKLVFLVLRKF